LVYGKTAQLAVPHLPLSQGLTEHEAREPE